jgi:predicted ABC-type ATPase
VLGASLADKGYDWFNPDTFSRELAKTSTFTKDEADAAAWAFGKERIEAAIRERQSYAFETTLGGNTIALLIEEACRTRDVTLQFCGLDSVERHIARVKFRKSKGGHDIPEDRIRARFTHAPLNVIALMPKLKKLQVFDNSSEARPDEPIPRPVLVLEMQDGKMTYPSPNDDQALSRTPDWSKPLLEAALRIHGPKGQPKAKP